MGRYKGYKCPVHAAMPKLQINQFKPDQQSRQETLRAYCPNIYTGIQFQKYQDCSTIKKETYSAFDSSRCRKIPVR